MKMMNYGMMRCISAVAIGVLLMVWPEAAIMDINIIFIILSVFRTTKVKINHRRSKCGMNIQC